MKREEREKRERERERDRSRSAEWNMGELRNTERRYNSEGLEFTARERMQVKSRGKKKKQRRKNE